MCSFQISSSASIADAHREYEPIEMLVRLATRQVVTVGTSETVVRLARNWAQQTAGPGRRQVSSNGPKALQFASIVGIR